MDDGMLYSITDEQGRMLCEPLMISWEGLYAIKRTFLCSVQYGQIVMHGDETKGLIDERHENAS